MTRSCFAALGAVVLVGAAAGDALANRPATRPAQAATPIQTRDRGSFNVARPGSAWLALGLNRRFLKPGDSWVMAWSSRTRAEVMKVGRAHARPKYEYGAPTYIRYQVLKVWRHRLGTGARTLATIRMSYYQQPLSASSTYADVTVDHYFNPVSFTLYSEALPYGKRQDKDTRRVLHGVGAFPLYVGDLENVGARPLAPPRVIPALARHRLVPGSTYAITVANGKNVHGITYWAPGNLYATYVVAKNRQGILVSQQKAR